MDKDKENKNIRLWEDGVLLNKMQILSQIYLLFKLIGTHNIYQAL